MGGGKEKKNEGEKKINKTSFPGGRKTDDGNLPYSKMEKSYVYILTNKDNNVLYTGVTSNLEERISQHREKHFGGFTARYNLTKVVYFEELPNIRDAIYREKQIKRLPRRRKDLMIERVNPFWEELMP